jgi:hypothetical protein
MSPTLLSLCLLLSQNPADKNDRLQFLNAKLPDYSLFRQKSPNAPLTLKKVPIVVYSNPEGPSHTGATYLWLDGQRPVAAISLSIRRPNDAASHEMTSFSATPLECQRNGTTIWSPKTGGLLAQAFADAPQPGSNEAQRLTQMRNLARRFTATRQGSTDTHPQELRLLTTPLYRFTFPDQGIVDGALFSFAISNDPDLFLLLEATTQTAASQKSTAQPPHWQYSLARMASVVETIRLDGVEVYSVANFHREPPDQRKFGPYLEAGIGGYRPSDSR